MIYSVTIEAFGRISVRKVEAASADEAIEKAKQAVGLSIRCAEVSS